MIERVDLPVSVTASYDHKTRRFLPIKLSYEGQDITIKRLGLHHSFREGRTTIHIFSVAGDSLEFRLHFNADTLNWRLQEISDGQVN